MFIWFLPFPHIVSAQGTIESSSCLSSIILPSTAQPYVFEYNISIKKTVIVLCSDAVQDASQGIAILPYYLQVIMYYMS